MFAGREDRIRIRSHTRRTRVRPSYHARQRNLKVRVVHAAEWLALLRPMPSVRYSRDIQVPHINGASLYKMIHYHPAIVLIGLKYYIKRSFKPLYNLMNKGALSVVSKVVRSRSITIEPKTSAKFALSVLQRYFGRDGIAIELTFAPPQINKR